MPARQVEEQDDTGMHLPASHPVRVVAVAAPEGDTEAFCLPTTDEQGGGRRLWLAQVTGGQRVASRGNMKEEVVQWLLPPSKKAKLEEGAQFRVVQPRSASEKNLVYPSSTKAYDGFIDISSGTLAGELVEAVTNKFARHT